MSQLQAAETDRRKVGIELSSKLDAVRGDILILTADSSRREKHVEAQTTQLANLKTNLEFLATEYHTARMQTEMLRSLYFTELRRRFDQIALADQRSNEWVFDPKQTQFSS